MGILERIVLCVLIPVGMLFVAGDFIATPLEKHRHSNVLLWLLWTLVRFVSPLAIVAVVTVLLVKLLAH
jgi:hypothetical protein